MTLAGCAGSLYSHLVGFISPDTFTFEVTAQVLSMVLIGGIGTTFGPVLGAVFIIGLPEVLRVSKEYYQVIYGAGVAFAVLFMPQGLLGLLRRKTATQVPSIADGGAEDEISIDDPAIERLRSPELYPADGGLSEYRYAYDLGGEWKQWTGLPFVFAVWVAQRTTPVAESLAAHASLISSRNWGLEHLESLAALESIATGVHKAVCLEYLSWLDYGLSYPHLAGLTELFRRLVAAGKVPDGSLAFLPAA